MAHLQFRHRLKRIGERNWVTFSRCFLMTMGLLFAGIPVLILMTQGDQKAEWPAWAWLLLVGLGAIGVGLACVGLFGNKSTTERWVRHADSVAHPEVPLFVAMIAAPLFFILKLFERR